MIIALKTRSRQRLNAGERSVLPLVIAADSPGRPVEFR
jgi:hypothetical protein